MVSIGWIGWIVIVIPAVVAVLAGLYWIGIEIIERGEGQ